MTVEEARLRLIQRVDQLFAEARDLIRDYVEDERKAGNPLSLETFVEHMSLTCVEEGISPEQTEVFIRANLIGWTACEQILHGAKP